ncbi:MAG: YebC/PmpR family DNA-binding transcriptional regulator [Patescibacteria group bacterium]|jgi:YebC/PmpR family DNA-binding regulatory protein
MSGHSKWATTKRAKSATDAKRGALFTKLSKAVTIAARLGGGDPSANFRLRLAIDQAKFANVPKDNIERAIKRGTGELAGGIIEQITYEGFGPGGSAIIIECLTDNRNRTAASIKHILTKYGGSFGGPNSVAWMFEQKGVINIAKISDDLELELIDAGSLDIIKDSDTVTIYTKPNDLKKIKELLEKKGTVIQNAEIEQVAKEKKELTGEVKEKLEKLFTDLDEDEDVNNYYTDAEA